MLATYQDQLQDLLNDSNAYFYTPSQLTKYINRARQIIARETQAVRITPTSTGSLASFIVSNGGVGYVTPPTVTISPPDGQGVGFINATAFATLTGPSVTSVTVLLPGTGYVNIPTVSFAGGGGGGAAATAVLTSFNHTVPYQEVYTAQAVNPIIQAQNAGIKGITSVQSVAVSWGSWKPVLDQCAYSAIQAYYRAQTITTQNFPVLFAQYGEGENWSAYLYPIPAQTSQMEWDCYCVPVDLVDDTTAEAIPAPFIDAICFLSAYYAYLNAQRPDSAQRMTAEYKRYLREARAASQPAMIPSFYGEY